MTLRKSNESSRSTNSPQVNPNIDNETKDRVKTMFGAQVIKPHKAYLGLPSLVGR